MTIHDSARCRVALLALAFVICAAGAVGASARDPWSITHLTIDPLSPSTLYAVARVPPPAGTSPITETIFRSDDGGGSWHATTTPSFDVPYQGLGRYITAIAVDPRIPGIVYSAAGTPGSFGRAEVIWTELFKSVDGGESWTSVLGRSNTSPLDSIVIDPIASSTLYVGIASIPGPQAILKSVDSGADWFEVSPTISQIGGDPPLPAPVPDAVVVLGIDPSDPDVIYAGGGAIPVYRTRNGGNVWAAASNGFPDRPYAVFVSAFAVAPSSPATLYAGTLGGIYVSADSGAHWAPSNAGLSVAEIRSLAIDPGSSSVAYAGTPAGLFKTSNRGALWSPIGFGEAAINAIAIDPSSPDTVYLGTSVGAFKSFDAGSSWTRINEGMHPTPLVLPVARTVPPRIRHHP
jgi:photosystem II stability/assembly factor-like uncharacterized protein